MGFFDFLFGQKKPVPQTAPGAGTGNEPGEARQLSLQELSALVEENREKFMPEIVPQCEKIAEKAREEINSLHDDLADFSRVQLDPQMQHYNIARQMKPEFEKRAPQALDSLKFPSAQTFGECERFHRDLATLIVQFTKISSDNRYLLVLFPENFKEIGNRMKNLASISDELGKTIEPKKTGAQKFDAISSGIRELASASEKIAAAKQEEQKAESELAQGKAELERAQKNIENQGPSFRAREKILRLEEEEKTARQKLRGIFSPLEHSLKKYARICGDNREAKAAAEYAEDAEAAAMNEPAGQPMLAKICAGAKESLETGGMEKDEKAKAKALAALQAACEGKTVETLVQRIALIKIELSDAQKSTAPLLQAERELEYAQKKLAAAQKKLSDAKQEANNARQQEESRRAALEKKAQEALGIKITVA